MKYLYRINIEYPDSENDMCLHMVSYRIKRKTPRGCWIDYSNKKGEKFILETDKDSKYRFAYPSIEQAFEAAKHRAKSYRRWSMFNVKRAEKAIESMNQGNDAKVLEVLKNQNYINLDSLTRLKFRHENSKIL